MRTRILALSMLLLGCSGNPSYETVMPTLKAELSAAKFDILTNNVTITEEVEQECVRSTKSKAKKMAGEFLGAEDVQGVASIRIDFTTTRANDDIASLFAKDAERLGYAVGEKLDTTSSDEWAQRVVRTDADGRQTFIVADLSPLGSYLEIYIRCRQLRQ